MQNDETKKTKWAPKLISLALGIIVIAALIFFAIKSQSKNTVKINDTVVTVEIADDSAERTRGLCCRDHLAENSGMLFVYSQPGDRRFWMKDTKIALDMYWIDNQKKIVHIEHSVQPSTYPQKFGTDTPARYILETNAGFAKKHDINIGDSVKF